MVHIFTTKCSCINHRPLVMMKHALKIIFKRDIQLLLTHSKFFLAVQDGLIFLSLFWNNSSHSTLTSCLQFVSSHRELTDVMWLARQDSLNTEQTAQQTTRKGPVSSSACSIIPTSPGSFHLTVEMGINPASPDKGWFQNWLHLGANPVPVEL